MNFIHPGKTDCLDEMKALILELAERRKDIPAVDKISWYYRHWKDSGDAAL